MGSTLMSRDGASYVTSKCLLKRVFGETNGFIFKLQCCDM